MYRKLDEQFEPKDVRRLKIIQLALETCRVSGRVSSYYIFEICRAIESGMLLASIELSTTLLELWIRDLLVIRKLTQTKISDKRELPYHLAKADIVIEGLKRGKSYKEMVIELQKLGVIEQSECEWLMLIFNKIRNPLHHGLSGRLLGHSTSFICLEEDEISKSDKIFAGLFSNSPHDRLNRFERFLDEEVINHLEGVVNFLAAHPIPKC